MNPGCEKCKYKDMNPHKEPCVNCWVFDERPNFEQRSTTNGDRIRAMTDAELAAWFIKIQDDTADYIDGQYSRNLPATSESWALWLKSPVEPEGRNDGKIN